MPHPLSDAERAYRRRPLPVPGCWSPREGRAVVVALEAQIAALRAGPALGRPLELTAAVRPGDLT